MNSGPGRMGISYPRSVDDRGQQGSYSNKEMKFQYIPGWIELNFQDIFSGIFRQGYLNFFHECVHSIIPHKHM